jgi:hypothetical protein
MKSKESISVFRGDTVWISDYDKEAKEGAFVCETADSSLIYKGKKGNVAFCVTYKTKSGKIKTKWVNRARVTSGARMVLTEKTIPLKEFDAMLLSAVKNELGMAGGFVAWAEIQNIIDGD